MDHHVATEILACLQGERTVFPYYRDRYGIGLLRQLSRQPNRQSSHPGRPGHGLNVAELKQSRYVPLLQKPRIRTVLSGLGQWLSGPRPEQSVRGATFAMTASMIVGWNLTTLSSNTTSALGMSAMAEPSSGPSDSEMG